jgi:hypothetical protein
MKERPILFSGPMVRAILEGRKTITRRVLKLQDYDGGNCYETRDGILRDILSLCPYGIPGDRLWVRETWADPCGKRIPVYRADEATAYQNVKWRPSIFMPRWASRITLEITRVRVERLQDITEKDAISEGVLSSDYDKTYRYAFSVLWDSINGPKYPWSDNPWVWVIDLRYSDLDDWIASFEEELNCGLWNGGKTVKAYETNTGTMGGE